MKYVFILFITFLFSFVLHAQLPFSQEFIIRKADSLVENRQFEAATPLFLRVSKTLSKEGKQEAALAYANRACETLWRSYALDSAIALSKRVLKNHYRLKIENADILFEANKNIASAFHLKSDYDSALRYLSVADQQHSDPEKSMEVLVKQGTIYRLKGDYEKAREVLRPSTRYAINDKHLQGDAYYELGIIHEMLGLYDSAIYFLHQSSECYEQIKLETGLASVHNSLGIVYDKKNQLSKSLTYYRLALSETMAQFGRIHPRTALTQTNIGNILNKLGKDSLALIKHLEAAAIFSELFEKSHPYFAMTSNNIGQSYLHLKKYDESIRTLKRGLDIQFKNFGSRHPNNSMLYINLGEAYAANNNFRLALESFTLSLACDDARGPHSVLSFYDIGELYLKAGEFDSANRYYDSAIFYDSNRNNEEIIIKNISYYMDALIGKLKVFKGQLAFKNPSETHRDYLATFSNIDAIITNSIAMNLSFEDEVLLNNKRESLNNERADFLYRLYEKTTDKQLLKSSFRYASGSKARVLLKTLLANSKASTRIIPEPIKTRMNSLQQLRTYYYLRSAKDVNQSKAIQGKLLDVEEEIDSLKHWVYNHYPKAQVLYEHHISPSIEDLQKRLSADEAILELEVINNYLLCFLITDRAYEVIKVEDFNEINDQVQVLLKEIQNIYTHGYEQSAHQLYHQLFKTVDFFLEKNKVKSLSIIPDKTLSFLPFELLKDKKGRYLLEKYAISYLHSSSYFPSLDAFNSKGKSRYIGYAPTYDSEMDSLSHLLWNEAEIDQASKIFAGVSRTKAFANEVHFKREAKHYDIVHMAMHASLVGKNPLLSHLIFATDSAEAEDNILYGYEILDLDIPAELLILSACNTGLGKLEDSEGIISLSYAFNYAGCRSNLMSLWAVDDQSTKEIVVQFLTYLSKGFKKDEALRWAKLEYLKKASPTRVHPYFWASLTLIGNSEPIVHPSIKTPWIIGFALLFVAGIVLFMLKRPGLLPKKL